MTDAATLPDTSDTAGFQTTLDQLSFKVDKTSFERMRFGRDEAPKLVRLTELVKGAVEDRSDVDINEEGGEGNLKRFVIKVHGQRIAGFSVALEQGRTIAAIYAIERSPYTVADGAPVNDAYDKVDEAWMAETLSALMGRIQKPEGA